jgi:hypothetical protein
LRRRVRAFGFRRRSGQALVEYVLVIAVIAVGLVLLLLHVRSGAGSALSVANCQIGSAGGGSPGTVCGTGGGGATPGTSPDTSGGTSGTSGTGGGGRDHPGYGWGHHTPSPGPPPGVPGQVKGPGGGNASH